MKAKILYDMSLYGMLDKINMSYSPSEEAINAAQEIVSKIQRMIDLKNISAKAMVGGSVAKGTHLAGDHDIDIFVRFRLSEGDISDKLEDVLSSFSPVRVHGSRDYFIFKYKEWNIEAIPVYYITSPAQATNIMDVSPLHVDFFCSHAKGLRDEVRLTKQFLKAQGLYGAESHIRGFSGHVVDILIIQYRSFYKLLMNAAKWKPPVIIDVAHHHKDALAAIDKSKHSPLIVVDPIQPLRNAAAALSEKVFFLFIDAARRFIRSPSEDFFVIKEFSVQELISSLKNKRCSILISIGHDETLREDIAGSKIIKLIKRLKDVYEREGFKITDHGWKFSYQSLSYAWFVFEECKLSNKVIVRGPMISDKVNSDRFLKKHPDAVIKNNILVAFVDRRFTKPHEVLSSVKNDFSNLLVSWEVFG